YGERDNPYAVLSRLGQRLGATLAPDAVLPTIVETVAQALKLPYAAIAMKQGEEFRIAATYGQPVQEPGGIVLPLNYQSESIGQLILAPRAPGEPFTPADRRLLADIAHQAGVALHAVRLTADLQRSRERLVTAREEERLRLQRDLHDGLGPALAAQILRVGSARHLFRQDPAATDILLNEMERDLHTSLTDIRRLVYGLRPPGLDELGLVTVIRQSVTRYSANVKGLHITVESPEELPPLPAAVEVAAYRIVQEALTNVVRHAQAHTCTVRLAVEEALQIEIADDGIGLPAEHRGGVGIGSMHERAAELGGTCVVEAGANGGTHVLARLPVPHDT
ncbi:MAG: GAF domain-containing sensor histidine kinase, partial [Chloroflexi bacterium]|nr:GAF domain-containing sensor histidine kinase [Chloroflexota bacterium]